MSEGRSPVPVRPALIEKQTGANEACNQIRVDALGRMRGGLGIQAARPAGALTKYLEFTSTATLTDVCLLKWSYEWGPGELR